VSRVDYDIAIIGAGAAGLIAADFALRLGVRVALMERDRIGGDCTWTGCVPSKSLVKVASVAADVRRAATFGLEVAAQKVNLRGGLGIRHQTKRGDVVTVAADCGNRGRR
jgi:pyruvate/2-oxoglutarate dehydrogenase complex dihydrolipoamide dehydrogenase (E3) component